jgi:hypothetical protein
VVGTELFAVDVASHGELRDSVAMSLQAAFGV